MTTEDLIDKMIHSLLNIKRENAGLRMEIQYLQVMIEELRLELEKYQDEQSERE